MLPKRSSTVGRLDHGRLSARGSGHRVEKLARELVEVVAENPAQGDSRAATA